MRFHTEARRLGVFLALIVLAACGGAPAGNTPYDLKSLRSSAKGSNDGEKVGRWLLDEMLAPGGTAKGADEARAQLDRASSRGVYAAIGGALYDEVHGDPKKAAAQYVAALTAAKASEDPAAPLAAWFASHHLVGLRGSVAKLWDQNKGTLLPIIEAPGHIGWRSLAELHEWSTAEALDKAEVTGDAYDALVTTRMGCARKMDRVEVTASRRDGAT